MKRLFVCKSKSTVLLSTIDIINIEGAAHVKVYNRSFRFVCLNINPMLHKAILHDDL